MPFKSKAQMRFLYAKHPDIAKRWEDKYGVSKKLPEHVGKKAKMKVSIKRGKKYGKTKTRKR